MITHARRLAVMAGVWMSLGASYRSDNFVIDAPTAEIARQVAERAEKIRREQARLWLGRELATLQPRGRISVRISEGAPRGASTFKFHEGELLGQSVELHGPLERILSGVLPHEMAHTLFAQHFGCPVPRWADEGGAILCEGQAE